MAVHNAARRKNNFWMLQKWSLNVAKMHRIFADLHRPQKQVAHTRLSWLWAYRLWDHVKHTHGVWKKINTHNTHNRNIGIRCIFITHRYTFIIHECDSWIHLPRSLGLLCDSLPSTLTHRGLGVQQIFPYCRTNTLLLIRVSAYVRALLETNP